MYAPKDHMTPEERRRQRDSLLEAIFTQSREIDRLTTNFGVVVIVAIAGWATALILFLMKGVK